MFPLSRFIVLLLIILLSVSACSRIPVEVCDPDGPVYLALVEHQQEWSDYFSNLPQENRESHGITFEIDGYPYVIRSLTTSTTGQPILLISTKPEYPGTVLGKAGYFYLPSGEFADIYEELEITQLSDHIYCYIER